MTDYRTPSPQIPRVVHMTKKQWEQFDSQGADTWLAWQMRTIRAREANLRRMIDAKTPSAAIIRELGISTREISNIKTRWVTIKPEINTVSTEVI